MSVGKWSVWVVDNEGKVFVRKEVTSVFPEGTHWQSVTDNLSGNKLKYNVSFKLIDVIKSYLIHTCVLNFLCRFIIQFV